MVDTLRDTVNILKKTLGVLVIEDQVDLFEESFEY